MSQIEHPLFKLSVKDESFRVALGVELRYLPVLLQEHHGVAGEFEPPREDGLRLTLVPVQNEVSEPVDGTELVDVASSHPQHLLNAILFDAIESLVERLFELSGR